jgi:GNAT superfamily N-acetyltransferase
MTRKPGSIEAASAARTLQYLPVESPPHFELVAALAREIWMEHYVPLIGEEQVRYMLAKFQSPTAIADQVRTGYEYFALFQDSAPLGYLAIEQQQEERCMFLSKLYVHVSARGTGLGRQALDFIASQCRDRGLTRLWLTVNKRNPAVQAYERLGFVRKAPVVMDIGNGFVMDDFRMELTIE